MRLNSSKIKVRLPESRDALALMDYFNELMEEGVQVIYDRKVGYGEEVEWLGKQLNALAKGELVFLVAELDGKIAGSVEVRRGPGRGNHAGELGISIGRDYRGKGLGERLMRLAIRAAKKIGIKLVWLQVFSTNLGAIRLYKKLGFRKEARLRKRVKYFGKYTDLLVMRKPLSRGLA